MQRLFLFILVSSMLLSCNKGKKFNSEEWKHHDVLAGSRLSMVDDLIGSKILISKSKNQVVDLLGENEFSDAFGYSVWYKSEFLGVDPIERKDLIINFSPDSIVRDVILEGWKLDEDGNIIKVSSKDL